jgi:phage terminase small subunit
MLGDAGKEMWSHVVCRLTPLGVLQDTDRHALLVFCRIYEECLRDDADYKSWAQFRQMAREFGLTPASRSLLKTTPPTPRGLVGPRHRS